MVRFKATIEKYGSNGDKTGWSYITVPEKIATELQPGNRRGFRVKGKLDSHSIQKVSIIPVGGGDFILPLNAGMRKATGKTKGAILDVQLSVDKSEITHNQELLDCLADDPEAETTWKAMTNAFRNYLSKWVESAKTDVTRARRISQIVISCSRSRNYNEFIVAFRELKKHNEV